MLRHAVGRSVLALTVLTLVAVLAVPAVGISGGSSSAGVPAVSGVTTAVPSVFGLGTALAHGDVAGPAHPSAEGQMAHQPAREILSAPTDFGARPASGFTSPVLVSTSTTGDQNGGPAFAYATNPSTVTDSAGYIWTSWSANVSGRWTIWFAYSANGGTSFSTPLQLDSAFATQDTTPDLAVYGSGASADIAVVWENRTHYTIAPATTDAYTLATCLDCVNAGLSFGTHGGESWIRTQGYGAENTIEGASVAWDDAGNALVSFWSDVPYLCNTYGWPACTNIAIDGYVGGTTYCPSSGTDGCWRLESITAAAGEYWPGTATACSSTTPDCSILGSWTNGDTSGSTQYAHTFYSTDNFNYDCNGGLGSGAGCPQGPSTITHTTFGGTYTVIVTGTNELTYATGNDSEVAFELNVASDTSPSYDVAYYYHSGATNAYTLGPYPTGSASTTGTYSATIAANPTTNGPYVSYVDSSDNIDATWSSTISGAFLSPNVVATGGADSATSIGMTTVASPSPYRVDVVYIDGEASPQVQYSGFLALYASAGASPTTVDLWQNVQYTSTPGAGAPGYTYAWTFSGACSPSCPTTVQNPLVNYTAAGTYTASVTVTDTIGETATASAPSVTVNPRLLVSVSPAAASVDSGQSLTFTATATGGSGHYTAYTWKLNGATQAGTGATFTTTFSAQGSDTVAVTVTDTLGVTSPAAGATVLVDAPLSISSISGSPNPAGVGATVTFSAAIVGGTTPYAYAWSLHGTTSSQTVANPTNTYSTPGNYTIYLNLTDSASGTPAALASATTWLLVDTPMTASASVWPTTPVAGTNVFLNATVTGGTPTYSYSWVFGDGTSSGPVGTASVQHKYGAAGTYTAHLFVNDSFLQLAKGVVTFTVDPVLTAVVSASPNPVTVGTAVAFSGSAAGGSGTYTSYAWKFGDGGLGAGTPASHTYATAGTYNVVLTVTDSAGHTATAPYSETVNSAGSSGLSVSLTLPGQADQGSPVAMVTTVTAGGTPGYSFAWTFGDGGTANSQSPAGSASSWVNHTYASTNTFTVSVTVTDSLGHSGTATGIIQVQPAGTLTATLTASQTAPDVGQTISFNAAAQGGSNSYSSFLFVFGDGQSQLVPVTGGATTESATHAYAQSAHYSAYVNVTDSSGTTVSSIAIPLNVAPPVLVAINAAPTTSGDAGTNVVFTADAQGGSGTYSGYEWRFGSSSSLASGSRQQGNNFTAAGTFLIEAAVTDSHGGTGYGFLNYTVNAPLSVSVTGSPQDGAAPLCVTFAVTVSGGLPAYQYSWAFGDGSTATTGNESWTHCYNGQPGQYQAEVTVTDSDGGTAKGFVTATVSPPTTSGGVGAVLGSWWWILLVVAAVAAVLLLLILRRRKPKTAPEEAFYAGGGAVVMGGGIAASGEGVAPMVPPGASDQSPDELGGVMDAPSGAAVGPATELPTSAPMGALPSGGPPSIAPACPRCGSALMGEGLPCPNCQYIPSAGEIGALSAVAPSAGPGAPPSAPELSHCPQCAGPLAADKTCPVCQVRWEPSAASVGATSAAGLPPLAGPPLPPRDRRSKSPSPSRLRRS
jgi:PKD repeat protein